MIEPAPASLQVQLHKRPAFFQNAIDLAMVQKKHVDVPRERRFECELERLSIDTSVKRRMPNSTTSGVFFLATRFAARLESKRPSLAWVLSWLSLPALVTIFLTAHLLRA